MIEQWDSFDFKTKDCSRQGCPCLGSPKLDIAQLLPVPAFQVIRRHCS